MVGIDQSLRMSIILKMIQPIGVALIINYPKPIDRYTRFLHFRYDTQLESCDVNWFDKIEPKEKSSLTASKTCVLTKIVRGIHAIVVLQLPPNQEDQIDRLLKKICRSLIERNHFLALTSTETNLLNQIISTRTYSNMVALTPIPSLLTVCQTIKSIIHQDKKHGRISYILSCISSRDGTNNTDKDTDTQIEKSIGECLENKLFRQFSELKVSKFCLYYELSELLQGNLSAQLFTAQQSLIDINKLYNDDVRNISNLVKRVRKNQAKLNEIEAALNSDVQITIQTYIHQLIILLKNFTLKGNIIQQLQNDGFEYCDVSESGINQDTSEETLREILFFNNPKKMIFCATDDLKQQSSDQWNSLYSQIQKQAQRHSQSTIVYADFTYSTWFLKKMTILSSKDQPISTTTLSQPESTVEYINILLLGESDVDKSIFINAFANYLHFDSLEKAKTGQLIVVVPFSFLMTTGQDFEEQSVKLGEVDLDENRGNIGQSTTQQCRSYLLEIAPQKKLRIINTPDFAGTGSNSQDQIDMNTIFSFVNNVIHLNAVCFLLKPNAARLNPFFCSCFTEIFEWFGEGIRDRLIFCFTNTQSTFFALGDTGPLLKSFFQSLPVAPIPFEKKNTVCFDNGAFRYLVALQNELTLEEVEENHFVKSWNRSVEESQRLWSLLCDEFHPYRRNVEWQSMKDIYYQINSMIRPMLEGIRNIQRNIILHQTNSLLRLHAYCVNRAMMIDYSLDRPLEKHGDFWIFSDDLRPSSNPHISNESNRTEYRLNYEFVLDQTDETVETLKQQQTFLMEIFVILSFFSTKNLARIGDPFFSGLTRMIQEEQVISHEYKSSHCNEQLTNDLKVFRDEYEQLVTKAYSSTKDESLSRIYELILSIYRIPVVRKQMDAIKAYQQLILISNERNSVKQATSQESREQNSMIKSSIETARSSTIEEESVPKPDLNCLSEREINILLLGQTGVGKTTFINAFANYLTNDTLQQAEQDEMQIIIPSSFSYTDGDTFDEKIIILSRESEHESLSNSGQSNTQQCRSFVFPIDNRNLRIIDTPSVGDTRGLDQDARNLQDILDHIAQYKHLNAVCILLKPNEVRLTFLFRFCINELLRHLHVSVRENLIFVFTNVRSSFYMPGSSKGLLQALFDQHRKEHNADVPFTKTNLFLLDNESFRYLALRKNDIHLDDDQTESYSRSWNICVKEYGRLMEHIVSCPLYAVIDTLSLNVAGQFVQKLARLINETTTLIEENFQLTNEYKRKMLEKLEIASEGIPQNNPMVDLLRHPRTVCVSERCCRVTKNGDGVKMEYFHICHDECYELGIFEHRVLFGPKLKNCTAMDHEDDHCTVCGCHWSQHKHTTYKLTTSRSQVRSSYSTRDMPMTLASFDRRIDDLRGEAQQIQDVYRKLAGFLHANAILPFNDATIEYIRLHLQEEKSKQDASASSAQVVSNLETMVNEYTQDMDLFTKTVQDRQTNIDCLPRPKPEEIFTLVSTLYQLPINGQRICEQASRIKVGQKNCGAGREVLVSLPVKAASSKLMGHIRKIISAN